MYNEQSLNVYSYVCGSPVEFRDWSGHKGIGGFFKKVGGAVSSALNYVGKNLSILNKAISFSNDDDAGSWDGSWKDAKKKIGKWWNEKGQEFVTSVLVAVAITAIMTVAAAILASTGIGLPLAWAIVGAANGFIIGGTNGDITKNPENYFGSTDGWKDFDIGNAIIGAVIGGAVGYLGQYLPQVFSDSGFTGYLSKNKLPYLDNIPIFGKSLNNYLYYGAGINTGSVLIYGIGGAIGTNLYDVPSEEWLIWKF